MFSEKENVVRRCFAVHLKHLIRGSDSKTRRDPRSGSDRFPNHGNHTMGQHRWNPRAGSDRLNACHWGLLESLLDQPRSIAVDSRWLSYIVLKQINLYHGRLLPQRGARSAKSIWPSKAVTVIV